MASAVTADSSTEASSGGDSAAMTWGSMTSARRIRRASMARLRVMRASQAATVPRRAS